MICQDGFITSHAVENIELLEDDKVKNFVGEYEPKSFIKSGQTNRSRVLILSVTMRWKLRKSRDCNGKFKEVILEIAKKFASIWQAENTDFLKNIRRRMLIILC